MSSPFPTWRVHREARRFKSFNLSATIPAGAVLEGTPTIRAEKLSRTLVGDTYVPTWSDQTASFVEADSVRLSGAKVTLTKRAMAASSSVGAETWRLVILVDRADHGVAEAVIPILLLD